MNLSLQRRYFRYFDWISFTITTLLLILGLIFVFSATYSTRQPISFFFKKQLIGALSGLIIYFLFSSFDLQRLTRYAFFGYFGALALLLYTVISGYMAMGARRWISLYFIRMQPAELVKLCLPAFIAYFFLEPDLWSKASRAAKFAFCLGMLGICFILIRKQPDLGTAIVILLDGLLLLWLVGLSRKFFIITGLILTIASPLIWHSLKPYQQQRISVLLGQGNSQKEGYQMQQAKIAIGSGGLWGKGLLKGTQNKLGFLPEDHNDFIFAVVAEEWGFVRTLLIIALFCVLFVRILYHLLQVSSPLHRLIGMGLLLHIMLSFTINIGMVAGLLPVVGIPMPLFTYGISNLWICLASLGWLNNITIRRFYY